MQTVRWLSEGTRVEHEPESQEPEAADRPDISALFDFDLPRFRLAYLGASVAAVYAVGFAVVSIHTARFGTPSYDLFRARYAAAGALFVFHAAFPALTGLAFLREVAVLKKARNW